MQFKSVMFDNPYLGSGSDRLPSQIKEDISLEALKDSVSSLAHRLTEVETQLSRKMDRVQCLGIVQKKVSFGHLKHYLDQLQVRMGEQRRQQDDRVSKMQEIAINKINDLAKKLKNIGPVRNSKVEGRSGIKQKNRRIQPQQLFLQSNETMFSLLVQQISKLQQKNSDLESQLQIRNKKVIALNNQVCRKIQKLQTQIEEKQSIQQNRMKLNNSTSQSKLMGNSWSQIERNNKPTVHKGAFEVSNFESVRMELLAKSVEQIQKDMLGKLNIKDILPIVKQNIGSISEGMEQLRQYVEESMDSTRKILASQTQINREISLGARVGWWLSYQQQNEIALFNKQLLNLLPQVFHCSYSRQSPNYITVSQQGTYILKILSLRHPNSQVIEQHSQRSQSECEQFQVMINTEVLILGRQSALRLQKNAQVRIIQRECDQLIVSLQKLT